MKNDILIAFLSMIPVLLHSQISNQSTMNSEKVFFEYQDIKLTHREYKEKVEEYNQLFDSLTNSVDIDYIEAECTETLGVNTQKQSSLNADLIYEKGKQYTREFLYKDLCRRKPNDYLINFFKNLADDKESTLIKYYLHQEPCECVKQSPEIQKIIFDYYESESFQDTNKKYEFYESLRFKLANYLGDIEQIADTYFSSLREKVLLSNEGLIIYKLAKAGKEEKALVYLEIIVNEVLNNEKKYAAIGDEADPFPLLCLSSNKEISQKATDLMFKYYEKTAKSGSYYTYFHLRHLAEFKNIQRCKELYIIWFDDYQKLDYEQKENRESYRRFINYAVKILAPEIGMTYWNNFVKSHDIFKRDDDRGDFGRLAYIIGFEVVKSETLKDSEKIEIFEYIRDNCEFDSYPDFYLKNLKNTFPNITMEEVENLLPEKFEKYSYLKPTWKRINETKSISNPTFEDAFKDLIKLEIAPSKQPKFSESDKFQHRVEGLHTSVWNYFDTLGISVWYDTEAGCLPVGYKELFELRFMPILRRNGIFDIFLKESVEKIKKEVFYTLIIGDSTGCYKIQFKDNSDWYNNDKFIHLINKLLQNRPNIKERFVLLDSGDQTSKFGFFEPGAIKLFAKKYGISTYVKSWEDEFATE